jgi:diguanylate cyclase (GGDEF)-like protein
MKSPEIPPNEEQRLKEVHSLTVIHSSPEERFERLTRLAKRLFKVPISVICFIGKDFVWVKPQEEFNLPPVAREFSFCGHSILSEDIMVVENALLDERFHDNPSVVDPPNIRFYVGCPIHSPGGAKVGTLCLLDNQPRAFIEDDMSALKDLALMVESEIADFQVATTDELTQISNRRGFMRLAQMVLDYSVIHQRKLSIAFMDLDKFKQINDQLGHKEGDNALIDFADGMKAVFRGSDLFARLGGDEFVVLFSDSSKEQAEAIIERLRSYLLEQSSLFERPYQIEFSVGIIECVPSQSSSIELLLKQSDEIMYRAKRDKR